MPTPAEQAAEESVAGRPGVAEASADPGLDDTNPIPVAQAAPESETAPNPEPGSSAEPTSAEPEPESPAEPAPESPAGPAAAADQPQSRPQPNRAATTSLIAGILGVTAIGAVLGLVFGAIGLARSRRVRTGKVRASTGIVLSLLWAGAFAYVAPHVIKAADPGCTAFKEKVLPHYNQAIEDLDTRATSNKTTADLATAVAGLASAAAQSKNPQARNALRALTRQLRTASNDQIGGQIPASVMVTLNHDAVAADNACGTI
jgi:hypothetical protein